MITVGGLTERIEAPEYDRSAAASPPLTVVPHITCGRREREYDANYSSRPYRE